MCLKHLEIAFDLKFHSDIREGIKEAKLLAWLLGRPVTILCNGVSLLVEKDSAIVDVVTKYHKEGDRRRNAEN